MNDRVYLSRIEIRNVGGIEELIADLGAVNVVVGDHGMGKTSFIAAIDIVLTGGTDPDLIRAGAEKGEVKLTLSDGVTIEKTFWVGGSSCEILTPEGGKVKRPSEYLSTLAAGYGFDPIGFLNAEPKARAEFLLKNLPLTFDVADIEEAIGEPVRGLGQQTTLQKLNDIRDMKYSERTTINVRVRDVEGAIQSMRRALPADDDKNWAEERDRLISDIATIEESTDGVRQGFEAEADRRKAEARAVYEKACADLDRASAEAIAKETKELEEKKAAMSLDLGTARERAEQQTKVAGVREAITKHEEELRGSGSRERKLTSIIKALDDLKHRKLKELPIDGFDLKADKNGRPAITIDGIPLEKVNRQRQLFVAIQAVNFAAGRLPLILCEAAELNDRALEELSAAAKDAGLQLVLARWSQNGPLSIVSEPVAA